MLGEAALSPNLPGLFGAQIQATKLQELPRVCDAPESARFGQDGERQDRAHPWECPETVIIRMARQFLIGLRLQGGAGRAELLVVL